MTREEKKDLLDKSKMFFIQKIYEPHVKRTKALAKLENFNVNPFLDQYLARFLAGNDSPTSLAETLILPRILGTSITGSFGTTMQKYCIKILKRGEGISIKGIDLVFTDTVDGRKKYCQLKSGPNTINMDDITTISKHFTEIKNLGRTNTVEDLRMSDICVGVLYGTQSELSGMYERLGTDHHISVFVGKDFWHRLTGDPSFYEDLIQAFREAAMAVDATTVIADVTEKLATAIKERDKNSSPRV